MANDTKKDTTTPVTPSDNMVLIDQNTLAATIATAVAQAMAAVQAQGSGKAEEHQALAAAISNGIASSTRRKVTNGEYAQRGPRNSYHPNSKAETPVLKRDFFQNDIHVDEVTLTDDEVRLLNRLTHSGRYFDRLVEVFTTEDAVHVRYNNKTPDHRFELKNHFRTMLELLQIVVKQQEAEDKVAKELEEEKLAERRKREEAKEKFNFGNSKASREAREKAGVE